MSEDTREIVERLRDAPIGTRAPAHGGGAWLKTPRGWKWNGPDSSGGTFPTPGGDWDGRLQPLDAEIVGKVVAELIRIQDTALQSHAVTSLLVRDRDAVAVGAAIIQSQQAEIERLSAQVPAPSGDDLVEAVADVVNRARYPDDQTPMALADEDRSGQDYARRISRKVLSSPALQAHIEQRVEEEREVCARAVEALSEKDFDEQNYWVQPMLDELAHAIRSRTSSPNTEGE